MQASCLKLSVGGIYARESIRCRGAEACTAAGALLWEALLRLPHVQHFMHILATTSLLRPYAIRLLGVPPCRRLSLASMPVSLTCGFLESTCIVDPSAPEEEQLSSSVSVILDQDGDLLGEWWSAFVLPIR